VYLIALVQMPEYVWLIKYNLAYIIESTRFMLLNVGDVSALGLAYTAVVAVVFCFSCALFFNRPEKVLLIRFKSSENEGE
jgi:lipopolysaccharide transport system permease protein